MTLESGFVLENWRSAVIVPLYKGKEGRTECSNYICITLLRVVGKIYAGILVDRVQNGTKGVTDDEQGMFRSGKGCEDKIFTLKHIGEKAW